MPQNPHPSRRVRGDEPFIGRGLRDVWAHFSTELLTAIRSRHPGATMATNQVMLLIDRRGNTVSELARRVGVTKQSMADTVRSLESQGLVTRQPDPGDRRAQLVTLTDEGWAALHFGLQVVTDLHARWTSLLGAHDMAHLVALLDRLARLLDEGVHPDIAVT